MPRFRENRDNEIQGTESQVGFEPRHRTDRDRERMELVPDRTSYVEVTVAGNRE